MSNLAPVSKVRIWYCAHGMDEIYADGLGVIQDDTAPLAREEVVEAVRRMLERVDLQRARMAEEVN